jgi:hypothetical protein
MIVLVSRKMPRSANPIAQERRMKRCLTVEDSTPPLRVLHPPVFEVTYEVLRGEYREMGEELDGMIGREL